jgi:hypothetical protein
MALSPAAAVVALVAVVAVVVAVVGVETAGATALSARLPVLVLSLGDWALLVQPATDAASRKMTDEVQRMNR